MHPRTGIPHRHQRRPRSAARRRVALPLPTSSALHTRAFRTGTGLSRAEPLAPRRAAALRFRLHTCTPHQGTAHPHAQLGSARSTAARPLPPFAHVSRTGAPRSCLAIPAAASTPPLAMNGTHTPPCQSPAPHRISVPSPSPPATTLTPSPSSFSPLPLGPHRSRVRLRGVLDSRETSTRGTPHLTQPHREGVGG
jgi:hypothetical protein